jgi:hypothetical protein
MDPTNPRWLTSEERTKRSATMWKIIVGAAGASALTAMVVASCLDRDVARRDLREPSFVETTSATPATPAPAPGAIPTATRDSTGGIAPLANANAGANGGADEAPTGSTTVVTVPGTTLNNTTTITSAPLATRVQPVNRASGDSSTSGVAGTTTGAPGATGPNAGPDGSNINPPTNGATDAVAVPAGANAGHASHANNDPNNRGSNPESPAMSGGAGRFVTEAPYWSSSAWTTDPEAGAGPFQTERNTPAH